MATAIGLLFYLAIRAILLFRVDWQSFSLSLISLFILTLILFYIARRGEVIGLFVVPCLIFFLFTNSSFCLEIVFLSFILLFILGVNIFNIRRLKLLALPKDSRKEIIYWRTLLRPLAFLFIIFSYIFSKNIILYICGGIALVFVSLDLFRLLNKGINLFMFRTWVGFFKQKEQRQFSSMTYFMTAIFILFLVFSQEIACLSSLFLIFGDLAAKYFGLVFGKTKFLSKSLEGTMAYFAFSLLAGSVFSQFVSVPYYLLFFGALTSALVEALSIFGLDDNFTVGLISAGLMQSFKFFSV